MRDRALAEALSQHPEALTETLLHEMIHAWCYAKFRDTGHGARFKRKLRECGLQLDLPRSRQRAVRSKNRASATSCDASAARSKRCAASRPRKPSSCPRCNKRRFDARYPLTIYEIVEMRAVGRLSRERARPGKAASGDERHRAL